MPDRHHTTRRVRAVPLAVVAFYLTAGSGLLLASWAGWLDLADGALVAVAVVTAVAIGLGLLVAALAGHRLRGAGEARIAELEARRDELPPDLAELWRLLERSGRRSQWLFFALGVLASVPTGIVVNLLTA